MTISFTRGKAAKWDGLDTCVQHRYGFNWFLWIPFIRLKFVSYGIYFDSSWLCYFWGFFLSYKTPKYRAGDCAISKISPSPQRREDDRKIG